MTRTEAVNYLLSLIGSPPVGDIDTNLNPDLIIAKKRLDEANLTIQKKKFWWFNTEHNWTIEPDVNGELQLPSNCLSVQVDSMSAISKRGDKLYNNANATYVFTEAVTVKLKVQLDWDLLDEEVQDTIKFFAGVQICQIDLEDDRKANSVMQFFTDGLVDMKKSHIKLQRRNIYNTPTVRKTRSGTRPYRNAQSILFGE